MSLISYATPWTNDETPKRKTSTLKRNKKPTVPDDIEDEPEEYVNHMQNPRNPGNRSVPTIEDMQNVNNEKTSRVNDLLNQMSSASSPAENNRMGEFKPMSPPSINVKNDAETPVSARQYVPSPPSYLDASNSMKSAHGTDSQYKANDKDEEQYGNYNKSYEPVRVAASRPYYANMAIGGGGGKNGLDDKMMEKINYMIHLMEEQQHEKTNNITEEFLLYTFLGVFVIYVLDSFARSGKYIR
jgi:chemotaxis protein CheY-P-specific phosphatase CheC